MGWAEIRCYGLRNPGARSCFVAIFGFGFMWFSGFRGWCARFTGSGMRDFGLDPQPKTLNPLKLKPFRVRVCRFLGFGTSGCRALSLEFLGFRISGFRDLGIWDF